MIYPGICSITLPHHAPDAVIALCRATGLTGIEWWGKHHVPSDALETASHVGRLTREAGLQVAAYGSYYRAGTSEADGLGFDSVLATALALGAPFIRVWAGNTGSGTASPAQAQQVIDDTLRIADLAAQAGVTLGFEHHQNTLTDSNKAVVRFAEQVQHPSVRFYWQPILGSEADNSPSGLREFQDRLAHLHVFHWTRKRVAPLPTVRSDQPLSAFPEDIFRHPLVEGADLWLDALQCAGQAPGDHWALLEFVAEEHPEQFQRDAKTLLSLLDEAQRRPTDTHAQGAS